MINHALKNKQKKRFKICPFTESLLQTKRKCWAVSNENHRDLLCSRGTTRALSNVSVDPEEWSVLVQTGDACTMQCTSHWHHCYTWHIQRWTNLLYTHFTLWAAAVSYTAASHQRVIDVFWLHLSGAVVSSIFTYRQWSLPMNRVKTILSMSWYPDNDHVFVALI